MMVATAVIALLVGGCRAVWLASRYRIAAKRCATLEFWCRSAQQFVRADANSQEDLALVLGLGPLAEDKTARAAAAKGFEQTSAYCAALRRKYEEAAAWPWSAADIDPSPPAP